MFGKGLTDNLIDDFLEAFSDVSNPDKYKNRRCLAKEASENAREQEEDYNHQFVTPVINNQDDPLKTKRKEIADLLMKDGSQ